MKKLLSKSLSVIVAAGLFACNKVETTQPVQADIIDAVFASGQVIADNEYQVTANTEGYLIRSFVDEGALVNGGMPLFQLSNDVSSKQLSNAQVNYQDALEKLNKNSPDRIKLELQIEQSKSQLELDKKNFERYQKLWESKAVSKLDFEKMELQYENAKRNVAINEEALADLINSLELNLDNAETQLVIQKENDSDYFLSSAIDGEVLQVFKKQGDLVRRGEVVAKIGGGEKLVELYIAEEDIREVSIGQEVILSLNTDRDQPVEGVISKIYPSFDEIEQSFMVEAVFKKEPTRLFHNTQLQANIIIGKRDGALVIPSQYLLKGDSVITKRGDLLFVRTGIRNDRWVEIVEGVNSSEVLQRPEQL